MSASDFPAWSREVAGRIETVLADLLPPSRIAPARLHDAMRYAALGGGKRVRPMLVFAAGLVSGAAAARLEIASAAVELIHAYSLVHDDLPCMDDDVLRRGKPTCHVEFDEATALLAGDALQSLAFQLLAENRLADDPELQLQMIQLFAVACGSRGMAGGQAIDLDAVGKTLTLPELENMHIHKTGALIRASVNMATLAKADIDPNVAKKLDHYAKCIGLSFQVKDDILDEESDTATLGKTQGKDKDNNKPTYPALLGLAGAKQKAQELHEQALDSLSIFGSEADLLRDLSLYIIQRDH